MTTLKKLSKTILFWSVAITIIFSTDIGFAQTKTINHLVQANYFNTFSKTWRVVAILGYVDLRGNTYLSVPELPSNVCGIIYPKERKKVIDLLKKSLTWSELSLEKQLETEKKLGSFMKGKGVKKHGVELTFVSKNKGKNTKVILFMQDFENYIFRTSLSLDPEQTKDLISLLGMVPNTVQELKEQEKKASILK